MGDVAVVLSGAGTGNDDKIAASSSRERICRDRVVAVLVFVFVLER